MNATANPMTLYCIMNALNSAIMPFGAGGAGGAGFGSRSLCIALSSSTMSSLPVIIFTESKNETPLFIV
jgi:hypothetical protein